MQGKAPVVFRGNLGMFGELIDEELEDLPHFVTRIYSPVYKKGSSEVEYKYRPQLVVDNTDLERRVREHRAAKLEVLKNKDNIE